MKLVCISDTHGKHREIDLPLADVVIHAGDLTSSGTDSQLLDFMSWFVSLPHQYKIFIAGNHDFILEKWPYFLKDFLQDRHNIFYLNDSGCVINGIKFWGSPITPWFFDWAFNRHVGPDIKKHWDLINTTTQILITHGPVRDMLDLTLDGLNVGCPILKEKILELPNLKYHICGHIHESYGTATDENGITYVNASSLNRNYKPVNKPLIITI